MSAKINLPKGDYNGRSPYAHRWKRDAFDEWLQECSALPDTEIALYTGAGDWGAGDLEYYKGNVDDMRDVGFEFSRIPPDEEIVARGWAEGIKGMIDSLKKAGYVPVLVSCSCKCCWGVKSLAAGFLGVKLVTVLEWEEAGGPEFT